MKILDRYVARSFLFSYMVCFLALTGLYVAVESFQITAELIEEGKDWSDILVTLPRYAAMKAPLFFYQVAPAVNLMAAIFEHTGQQPQVDWGVVDDEDIALSGTVCLIVHGSFS